jgi:hypothetical protein
MNPFETELDYENIKDDIVTPNFEHDYSVGSIRYSFCQLRNCKTFDVDYVLWSGKTAGIFAVEYLILSNSSKRKK